jgi:UDP-N-acetylmuramoyl-L-alanyl-D-glutamate--2,6-diaminopimelate ligase
MTLEKLLEGVEVVAVAGDRTVPVRGLAYDSREVQSGTLFAAIRGEKADGHDFIGRAVGAGAVAVMSERPPQADVAATWVQVGSVRRALAQVAAAFFGHPARALKLIGVTGTNGKTTTAFLLESILRTAGERVGLFGTVEYHTADGIIPARQTTPESLDLQRFLAELRAAGAGWAVMEVSSHGLVLARVHACPFAAAIFSNLARDHLDFHQTMENYFEAKKRLFLGTGAEPPALAVLNADDPYGLKLKEVIPGKILLCSVEGDGETITAQGARLGFGGTRFTLRTPTGAVAVESSLIGRSNLYNLLAAAATAYGLGVPLGTIAAGIRALQRVPGRFETIDMGQPFTVVVDFAHTDLAFTNLLQTARELAKGRVIIVFGSGGDRDRTKRPVMGEIAGRLADHVILTTDNPRSEDPVRIINDIVVGVQEAEGSYTIEVDRGAAFERAFDLAGDGDIVLLAGKGHQDTQIYHDHTEPWSDEEVARRLLAGRGFARAEAASSNAHSKG